MRVCPKAWLQGKGTKEPETNLSVPQQEEQSDTAEGKVITNYNLGTDYEWSEPKNEPDPQEEKGKNSDAE